MKNPQHTYPFNISKTKLGSTCTAQTSTMKGF